MWNKIQILLAAIPAIGFVVFGLIGYQVDQKSYELEAKKFREGQIPKKSLQIRKFGGSNLMGLLISFEDATFSVHMAGKELKNLYSISYHIENTGEAPILKSDFSKNLRLTFPERWQILVLKSERTFPPEFNPVWEKISNQELQLKPLLINPGDRFGLEVYLTDTREGDPGTDAVQRDLGGIWTVRIPNLSKIDIKDPLSSWKDKTTARKSEKHDAMYYLKVMLEGIAGADTLWKAGFLNLPTKWGVYAILALAGVMIFVFLNLLYPLLMHSNLNEQSRIVGIIVVSVFSFTSSECYITFFALLGKGVPWINYVFMFLYLLSVIILLWMNRKRKVASPIP